MLTLTVHKVKGGYEVAIEEPKERAVATTPRQAAKRAAELIEAALTKDAKK